MMNYGFCLPNNSCDYRIVSLRAPPGSPLDQAKAAQRQMYPEVAAQTDDNPYYVFNIFYPLLAPDTSMEHSIFSPALFNAVSILAANDRELESLEITELGIRIPNQYGTSRTTLAALSQIIIELITHVVKLRSSGADLQQPQNIKQTHAKVYRDSQILLSETALVIAAWTLARSQQHSYTGGTWEETKTLLSSHMARVPANKFPDEITSRIRVRILERPSILPHNGELFTLDDLYGILPEPMQQPCKTCLQSILATTERALPMFQGNAESSPFVFPLFVCFVVAAYRTNAPSLSAPRLSRWAQLLLDKYPPPPDDVAWMLEDEDDEQLVTLFDDEVLETMRTRTPAAFSALSAYTGDWQGDPWWLSPNWIRWAWMLVEQESVQVPDDPLRLLSAQGQVMLSTVSTLYIPQ